MKKTLLALCGTIGLALGTQAQITEDHTYTWDKNIRHYDIGFSTI